MTHFDIFSQKKLEKTIQYHNLFVFLQLQSERTARHIAQILLSNHHLTTRIIEQANLRWSYALSVDFSHSRLGACGEPDRRCGESALSPCQRVCATY